MAGDEETADLPGNGEATDKSGNGEATDKSGNEEAADKLGSEQEETEDVADKAETEGVADKAETKEVDDKVETSNAAVAAPDGEQGNKKLYIVGAVAVLVIIIALAVGLAVGKGDKNKNKSAGLDGRAVDIPPPPIKFGDSSFNRIASFAVCLQLDETCNVETETVGDTIVATKDGNTLIYSDSETEVIGFIDITDPSNPIAGGTVDTNDEPVAVDVLGSYALVVTERDSDVSSGILQVIDIATRETVHEFRLPGEPSAIGISPDENFAAITIENSDGDIPTPPPGILLVVDTSSDVPADWTITEVELINLEGAFYRLDPEPEDLDINENNICVITLQENNALVLVDLETATVIKSFSAGTVEIDQIDVVEDNVIEQTGSLTNIRREPDSVRWIGTDYFATADEGELDNGGGRGFTIWDTEGNVVYTSGNEMEHWAARIGHYPEDRSDSRGIEPETVHYAEFDEGMALLVGCEKAGIVFVYDVSDPTQPTISQILPTGLYPDGIASITSRNLFVVTSTGDDREDEVRAQVMIYQLGEDDASYPTLISADRSDGTPIPFSALSGLAADGDLLYTVEDDFYKKNRIMAIDTTAKPAELILEMRILDSNGILANSLTGDLADDLINDDNTVNLDLEGIDVADEGFWIVSEGAGAATTPNLLIKVDESAVITEVVTLPQEVEAKQRRFGFEGVAVDGDYVVVAFQIPWADEDHPRLGIYNTVDETWKFVFYRVDSVKSQRGGWVGIGDIASLGDGAFLVLERDNHAGFDAAVKRVYQIDLRDYSLEEGTLISDKIFVRDLIPHFQELGGMVVEKMEGLAVDSDGNVWVNNDNGGVDDNSGEQQLLNLGDILSGINFSRDVLNRIATFPACLQLHPTCNIDTETVSESIYASDDGNTLIYTDSVMGSVGFIDIADPANPLPLGVLNVGAAPSSVAVVGKYALVAVDTSPNESGNVQVVDIAEQAVTHTMALDGQPVSVAASPDKSVAAVAIENSDSLTVIDTSSEDPESWSLSSVQLKTSSDTSDLGVRSLDINEKNICVVTLQSSNSIATVDLGSLSVLNSFSAGTVDLFLFDSNATDSLILQDDSLTSVPREPNGVTWIGTEYFATADEGLMGSGSRGMTIWDTEGNVIYTSGNEMEHWAVRTGHFPDDRSESRGIQPTTVRHAKLGEDEFLLVGAEFAGLVFVYDLFNIERATLRQVLPTGVQPSGSFAIPSRNLFVVSSSEDDRDEKFRAQVTIYQLGEDGATYPTLISADRKDGTPIPFSALSGLAAADDLLFTVEDSYYKKNRIMLIDARVKPAELILEMRILDSNGILANSLTGDLADDLINDDNTVNLDLEGIDVADDGLWIVSEGAGTDTTPNLLIKVDRSAVITEVVTLPQEVETKQQRYGFEGVAVDGDYVVVAFQRAWADEDHPRLGIYNTVDETWKFVFYPLDTPGSQRGGWVGIGDIASLGDGAFLVLERDNQGGFDAAVKRVYQIDLRDFSLEEGTRIDDKIFVRDLIPHFQELGGMVAEKVEGLAVDSDGNVWVNNDNDGVDGTSGEQQLLNLGDILSGINFVRANYFGRVASFLPCLQLDSTCNIDTETVSESIYASDDGNTLIYTDSVMGSVGFIDIADPANPLPLGVLNVGAAPSSVAVIGKYALVAVDTSPNESGNVQVVDIAEQAVTHTMDLDGQPVSVAVSPDKSVAAVAIENSDSLTVIDTSSEDPASWSLSSVQLTSLGPTSLDINSDNICVVTLQLNNSIATVDLESLSVLNSFSAGIVNLNQIDVSSNKLILQDDSLTSVPREPNGVTWIGTEYFATADEGLMGSGSRGMTIWDTEGNVIYTSGNEMEHWAVRAGHFSDNTSGDMGIKPNEIHYSNFQATHYLFVTAEQAGLVFVYNVTDVPSPVVQQVLPTGYGPKGIVAIPSRSLFGVASQEDDRGSKYRAQVSIYSRAFEETNYPTLVSADRDDGTPIPFSALSSLAATNDMLYTVEDSYYKKSRIMAIDVSKKPPEIVSEMRVVDPSGLLSGALPAVVTTKLVNADNTVNLDPEGIDVVDDGFWIVSEGSGTNSTPNLLMKVSERGVITDLVTLPDAVAAKQRRFGFKGVAVDGFNVVVAFQRAWTGENHPRIGIYNTINRSWKFLFYPLDARRSVRGGWVGLSDIASLGNGEFLVLERDDQAGLDAAVKRLYHIDLRDYSLDDGSLVDKKLVRDIIPDFQAAGGLVPEKIEGVAVAPDGHVWMNSDNDGAEGLSGESLLIDIGPILRGVSFSRYHFNRLASFAACQQLDATCNVDDEAEIESIWTSKDGKTVVYADPELETVSFVDIANPTSPRPLGSLALEDEPLAITVVGDYALVAVDTDEGTVEVIHIANQTNITSIVVGEEPVSVRASPGEDFVVVTVDNSDNDEDGMFPGYLKIIDTSSVNPLEWTLTEVGLPDVPTEASVNEDNICAVILHDENTIALVDLKIASVVNSFSAGTVDIDNVDVEDNSVIGLTGSLSNMPREPSDITWIDREYFATADEGDNDGGARGFTIWNTEGKVVYTSGNEMDYWAVRTGHYPEARSDSRGIHPRTVRYAEVDGDKLLFVSAERASLVYVYEVDDPRDPALRQVLPTGYRAKGIVAIPSRNLVVVASDADDREEHFRSQISVYKLEEGPASYPTLISSDRSNRTPIPFSSLSGLTSDGDTLYTIEDSYFDSSRILAIDSTQSPAMLVDEKFILDSNGVLGRAMANTQFPTFILNDDGTVNIDGEGIEKVDGGFWIANEGQKPFFDNMLMKVDTDAVITDVVTLPAELNANQTRLGFEGVAVEGNNVVVAFAGAWIGADHPRIGIYNTVSSSWKFVFYPLDPSESQVVEAISSLTDLASLGSGSFLVSEIDDQAGFDAAIKRLYRIELGDFSIADGTILSKTLVRDLIPDFQASGGSVPEKIGSVTVTDNNNVWVMNDNGGVDQDSGETQLLNLGPIL